jgi:hypothetical protein
MLTGIATLKTIARLPAMGSNLMLMTMELAMYVTHHLVVEDVLG